MNRASRVAACIVAVCALIGSVVPVDPARADTGSLDTRARGLEPVTTVTITPPYGFYTPPIRVRLSATERRVIARLGRESLTWTMPGSDIGRPVTWHVEPSARSSPTLASARQVLTTARNMLSWDGRDTPKPVHIVVGRTQDFLKRTVASLGCAPQLSPTSDIYLMGATLCAGSVIVINLTGYLFIRARDQRITSYLERLAEPTLAATWYLIADRNVRSLAHEWVHVTRFSPSSLRIARNEPAWLREGLAETLSGMAAVRSTRGKLSYLEHHVIAVRKFSNWTRDCDKSLRAYRERESRDLGCEYFAGASAASLLLADHGGLDRLLELYRAADAIGDWVTAFSSVYGMTLEQFEAKADRYIAQIRTLSN